ncbi:MAG: hypothetical protein V4628_11605 [Pseudomonadota bacterium]
MSDCPEHEKRDQRESLHPDVVAAYNYVNIVVPTADYNANVIGAPLWHGWALREAFLAGISHAEKQEPQWKSA